MHCVIKRGRIDRYVDDREDTLELHHKRVAILSYLKQQCEQIGFLSEDYEILKDLRIRSAQQLLRDR